MFHNACNFDLKIGSDKVDEQNAYLLTVIVSPASVVAGMVTWKAATGVWTWWWWFACIIDKLVAPSIIIVEADAPLKFNFPQFIPRLKSATKKGKHSFSCKVASVCLARVVIALFHSRISVYFQWYFGFRLD